MSLPILFLVLFIVVLGIVLSVSAKIFQVSIDKRVKQLVDILPSTNCGACGFTDCSSFAESLLNGKAAPTQCLPAGAETVHKLKKRLNAYSVHNEEFVAAIHCIGGKAEATERALYDGIADCHAAVMIGNGTKECQYSCLGLSSCVKVCEFGAISITSNGIAKVDHTKCTGCTDCVTSCPRDLITMVPKAQKIFLGCNNHDHGSKVKNYCTVGCTGCTLCVKAVTHPDSIRMDDGLPVLSYTTGENFITASYRCPSNCFVDTAGKRPIAHINVKCTGCGDCVPVCPVPNTISGTIGARHTINKDSCIGCGLCLPVCEPGAIALWGSLGYSDRDRRTTGRYEIR